MQKSLIDRVFPKPKKAILPQYDPPTSYHDEPQHARSEGTASTSNTWDSRSPPGSVEGTPKPQPVPMSASIIHHEDPFLAVDRAAQNLQRTIQSLLDFQYEALNGRLQGDGDDASQSSLTPTRSTFSGSARNLSASGAMPLRQPAKKKITLKGARRGIGKSMHEFAALKAEELRITENEKIHRKAALDKIAIFETKRESVQHEITTLQHQASESESNNLRQEARVVQDEIHELEGRLMELKAKHRHLSDRAEQLENTTASELSSYQGALSLVDKEVRKFLKHPPVRQGLGPRSLTQGQDMYSLRPERRTLELAKEQWSTELETLDEHKTDTENEKNALLAGSKVWREVVTKIDDFEQLVRSHMRSDKTTDSDSTSNVVASLDTTMQFLQQSLQQAESKDWKLLICAIGPELESFRQARTLLAPGEAPSNITSTSNGTTTTTAGTANNDDEEEDNDIPHADLLNDTQSPSLSFHPTISHVSNASNNATHNDDLTTPARSNSSSNESLEATLKNIGPTSPSLMAASSSARIQASIPTMKSSSRNGKGPEMARQNSTGRGARESYPESDDDDDDPGPDFLVSH